MRLSRGDAVVVAPLDDASGSYTESKRGDLQALFMRETRIKEDVLARTRFRDRRRVSRANAVVYLFIKRLAVKRA